MVLRRPVETALYFVHGLFFEPITSARFFVMSHGGFAHGGLSLMPMALESISYGENGLHLCRPR